MEAGNPFGNRFEESATIEKASLQGCAAFAVFFAYFSLILGGVFLYLVAWILRSMVEPGPMKDRATWHIKVVGIIYLSIIALVFAYAVVLG